MLITHQLVFHTGSLDIRKLIANRMMIPVSLLNVGFKSISFQNHQRNRTLDVEKSPKRNPMFTPLISQGGNRGLEVRAEPGQYAGVLSLGTITFHQPCYFFPKAAFHDAFWGEDFPWAGCSVALAGGSGVAR